MLSMLAMRISRPFSRTFSIVFSAVTMVIAADALVHAAPGDTVPAMLAATGPAGSGTASGASGAQGPSFTATGYLSARYLFRSAETASSFHFRDQDVYGELRLDVTTPRSGRYEFHFLGTVQKDLDGNQDVRTHDPLEDIGNATTSTTFGNVFEAHLDINGLLTRLTQVRLGRQAGTRDEAVFFDGIAFDYRLFRAVNLTVYGGTAVHFYEIDNGQGSDAVAGAGIDLSPTDSTNIHLDYLSLKDARNYLQFSDVQNKLVSLRLWQRFGQTVKANAKVRYQDSDLRDLSLRMLGTFPDAALEVGVGYFRQYNTQNEQANELSPLWDVMGPVYPYQTIEIKVRKFLWSRYAIDLGYLNRSVDESSNKGTFNRDYDRATLAFTASDLFAAGLSMTLSGDQWSSEGSESFSGGADITYRTKRRFSASVGSYYSMYKYDEFLPTGEVDRVRTYYVALKMPLVQQFTMNLGYELEKGIDVYTIMKAGARYDF